MTPNHFRPKRNAEDPVPTPPEVHALQELQHYARTCIAYARHLDAQRYHEAARILDQITAQERYLVPCIAYAIRHDTTLPPF